ncbi:hypothetical protein [Nibricoccus aquaticus]|uniref:hypothetical protein n=1 Tax=Nibricoccus aquaticus TaxID=2576891 RepID=UPI0015867125|nr:hypothetical protein [Nibricoccus aquaticus]
MQFLKAALAGLFVLAVGVFTAAVIAVSALVLFVGRFVRGRASVARGPVHVGGAGGGRARATSMAGGDVIDVDATEVPATTSGR